MFTCFRKPGKTSLKMELLLLYILQLCHAADACKIAADCSYLGRCLQSQCICNGGWYGPNCDQLNLSSTIDYSRNGYHDSDGLFTWDGSPIFDETDGKWHLFNTILTEHCQPQNWLSTSRIAHVVSDSDDPLGPYSFSDIALDVSSDDAILNTHWDALSVYNPVVIKDVHFSSTGIYYLFYSATTMDNAVHPNCTDTKDPPMNRSLRDGQAIGYATSKSLYGPWIRSPANPVLVARPRSDTFWDSAWVCNPFPVYLSNGSMAVIYKGVSRYDEHHKFEMNTGIAMINGNAPGSWDGPYTRFDSYFNDPGNCEDGFFWEQIDDDGVSSYHMQYHCSKYAVHAYSLDLMQWTYGKQQSWMNVELDNGTVIELERRERPAMIFENERHVNATHLFNAVYPQKGPSFNLVQQL